MEKIDIIIPAYNAETTINRCINSLLDQSITDTYKIIVLNDGSTDNTIQKLSRYKNNEQVKIIDKENSGASSTRNQGLDLVEAEYVTFVDADDYVEKDYLLSLMEQYKNKQCDLAIVGYVKEDSDGQLRFKGLGEKKYLSRKQALHDIFISTGFEGYLWNKLFKTSIIKKNNLKFDDNIKIAEDLLFCCQYIMHCKKIGLNPKVNYHYVVNFNSQINSKKYGNDFDFDSLDILNVYDQIKNLISTIDCPKVISAINAVTSWGATSIIRIIYLAPNKQSIPKVTIKKLKKIQKKYRKDFLSNDVLPNRDKLIYLLNYYSPSLFAFLWKRLSLRGNGY